MSSHEPEGRHTEGTGGSRPTHDTVERLYEALASGERAALEDLLGPLTARLRQLAKQRLRDETDVEEVVQQTLATLWEKRDRIRDRDHLFPFLFQVLRNKIGNLYQQRERERARRAEVEDLERVPGSEDPLPEALLVSGELEALVSRAIERCARENGAYGEVLAMLHDGLTAAEIRARLGDISITALRTRICRARQRLRSILEQEYQIRL